MAVMMNLKSSSMSTVSSLVLISFDFFLDLGFMGETFLLLDNSLSSEGFYGSVTSPCFC
jgi:hypothetical protein